MYSINKKSTRKTNVKRNKKTKHTVGKNSKKRTIVHNEIFISSLPLIISQI